MPDDFFPEENMCTDGSSEEQYPSDSSSDSTSWDPENNQSSLTYPDEPNQSTYPEEYPQETESSQSSCEYPDESMNSSSQSSSAWPDESNQSTFPEDDSWETENNQTSCEYPEEDMSTESQSSSTWPDEPNQSTYPEDDLWGTENNQSSCEYPQENMSSESQSSSDTWPAEPNQSTYPEDDLWGTENNQSSCEYPEENMCSEPQNNSDTWPAEEFFGDEYDPQACSIYDYNCEGPATQTSTTSDPYSDPVGMQSIDPALSSHITDIPPDPHAVLEAGGMSGGNPLIPELEVYSYNGDGNQGTDVILIKPEESGFIEWHTYNATHVQINGVMQELSGSQTIAYDIEYCNSEKPFEIVAWNEDPENSVVWLINAKMQPAPGSAIEVHFTDDKEIGDWSFEYFKISGKIGVEFVGKWTPDNTNATPPVVWNGGMCKGLSMELKDGHWKLEPKLVFKGVPQHLNAGEVGKSKDLAQVAGGAEASYVFNIDQVGEGAVSIEIMFVLFKMSRTLNELGKDDWGFESGDIVINIGGTIPFDNFKIFDGTYVGTAKPFGELSISPEWRKIALQTVKAFGPDLLTAATVVLTSPVTVAAAVTGLIVLGYSDILGAQHHVELRYTVEELGNEIKRGVQDGLSGANNQLSNVTVKDAATAYLAGVNAGVKKRQELEADGEPFDERNQHDKDTIFGSVRHEVMYKLHSTYFSGEAASIKQSWMTYVEFSLDTAKKLRSAWNNIIGEAPAGWSDGRYLQLWNQGKDGVSDPGKSWWNGNW